MGFRIDEWLRVVPLLDFVPGVKERNGDEDYDGFPAVADIDL